VPEFPDTTDPLDGENGAIGRDGAGLPPKRAGRLDRESPAEGKPARKKKTPIINRRGPSEVDRVIRMSQARSKEAKGAGRKPPETSLARGTVIHLDPAKGFGFLIDSAGEHRFFHRSAVVDSGFDALKEQQAVEFEPHDDQRGARALKVRPAGAASRPNKPSQSAKSAPKAARTSAWRSDLSPFRNGTGTPTRTRKRL